jgi:hypothetical protein
MHQKEQIQSAVRTQLPRAEGEGEPARRASLSLAILVLGAVSSSCLFLLGSVSVAYVLAAVTVAAAFVHLSPIVAEKATPEAPALLRFIETVRAYVANETPSYETWRQDAPITK